MFTRHLIELFAHVPPTVVHLLAAVLVAAETALLVGVAVPTLTVLLLLGYLAHAGTLDLPVAFAAVTAAAVCGDTLAFHAGRRHRLRATMLARSPLARRVSRSPHRWWWLAGRFVTVARTLTPRLAGASGAPYRAYAVYAVPAALGWAALELAVGYAAGAAFPVVADRIGRATVLVALAAVVAAALIVVYKRRREA